MADSSSLLAAATLFSLAMDSKRRVFLCIDVSMISMSFTMHSRSATASTLAMSLTIIRFGPNVFIQPAGSGGISGDGDDTDDPASFGLDAVLVSAVDDSSLSCQSSAGEREK